MRRHAEALALAFAVVLCSGAAPAASAAQPDVGGSRDPYGLERFPGSWIVAYERETAVRPRELIVSRVDRVRRELRVDDPMQVEATEESVTYQIPDGASVADVADHYQDRLGSELLFRCEGRDCGRSADWANQVFGESILYGPDQNQRYAVLEWQDRFVSLYVIERGNKRVYAHLRFLDPQGDGGVEPNALLARRLSERGWVVIEGVQPRADGTIATADQGTLAELGSRLAGFTGDQVHLVCHLYDGAAEADDLLSASRRCAEEASRLMRQGLNGVEGGQGPGLEPFGAGPLVPRSAPPVSRIELVLPSIRWSTR